MARAPNKIAHHLPEEIWITIFSKLPPRSVGKCRCVSKTWRHLLSSPNIGTREENLILISTNHSLHAMPISEIEGTGRNSNILPDSWTGIVGSCNGLVLLRNGELQLSMVNPVTLQRINVLDSRLLDYSMLGFGYDSSTDDYKIVTLNETGFDFDASADVYSVKREVWRRLDGFPSNHYVNHPEYCVFVNGALHWVGSSREPDIRHFIGSLNLAQEVFHEIPFPSSVDEDDFLRSDQLLVLGECLCVMDVVDDFQTDFWIMKEYGSPDSWTIISICGYCDWETSRPVCLIGDEEVIIRTETNLVAYNLKLERFRDIDINGVPVLRDAFSFIESLASTVFRP